MAKVPTTWALICKKKGISPTIPFDVSMLPKEMQNYFIACYQNPIIIEVLNDGWIPDYTDMDQPKYEIRWRVNADKKRPSGFGLSYDNYVYWNSFSLVGVRHCFKDYNTMMLYVKHFKKVAEHQYLKIK